MTKMILVKVLVCVIPVDLIICLKIVIYFQSAAYEPVSDPEDIRDMTVAVSDAVSFTLVFS